MGVAHYRYPESPLEHKGASMINVIVWTLEQKGLTPTEKLVALILANHAHKDGSNARPGQRRICEQSGLSEASVRRSIKSLLEKGTITKARESTATMPASYTFPIGGDTVTGDSVKGVSHRARGGITVTEEGYHPEPLNRRETSIDMKQAACQLKAHEVVARVRDAYLQGSPI
jgi:hypothetical protein